MTGPIRRPAVAAIAGALLLAGTIGGSHIVAAHSGASGVVEVRMHHMKDVAAATKALAGMMRGKTAYDADRVRALAERIAGYGGGALTETFPEGSLDPPTEARPRIWADWARFAELADRMRDDALALAEAADNPRAGSEAGQGGDLISQAGMTGAADAPEPGSLAGESPDAAFRRMTQVCSACHGDFRVRN